MVDEEPAGYRWETGYEKTWEALKEDDDGLLEASVADIVQREKRKRLAQRKGRPRLGMMRYTYVVIDTSEAMSLQDLKPTRFLCTLKLLEEFIEEFLDQNPLSQMGVIIMRNKRAERVSPLGGNSRRHVKTLQSLSESPLVGEPSIQNALEMCLRQLRSLPMHACREIIILSASLTTCDPTDIHQTIQTLKTEGVRCSVIGLAAEVRVCRQLCQETGGTYGVILDDCHYRSQLLAHVPPPANSKSAPACLVKMGFPHNGPIQPGGEDDDSKDPLLTICMCHLEDTEDPSKVSAGGHLCPQCRSRYCELPAQCRTCDLTLASAPHLARSYHHLFPVDPYKEMPYQRQTNYCYSCVKEFEDSEKFVYLCGSCNRFFCMDCDLFVHESLHVCPGCASLPAQAVSSSSSHITIL
ncbi:general transcription factor IIH subunit 2 Ssl1 [Arctopsyche grandis]|uniref:general transcription factor IIH subunit 2 Ssl1 n=1 Tax=Arctopsyche grandis TaxID=121162 RepID=UPI00406D7D59